MGFHWRLSGSKSPQVSGTLLSILTDLNNIVVWTVSTRSLISKSFSLCTNPSMTLPSVPITIGFTITFMSHSIFSSLARSRYLSHFRFLSVLPYGQSERQSLLFGRLSFLLTVTRSGHLADIRWSVCVSKAPETFVHFIFKAGFSVAHIPFFVWSN